MATSHIGLVQPTPAGAQATTEVVTFTTSPVTVGVTSSEPESRYGQSLNFTATVAASGSGSPTSGGNVQFEVDGQPFGAPVALVGGQAVSPATTSLAAGDHTVIAVYSGDAAYAANTGSVPQMVDKAP